MKRAGRGGFSAVGAAAIAVAALAGVGAGCGGAPAAAPAARLADEPRWEDVFARVPDLVVVLRPTALRADPVYGPLLERVIEFARTQSRVVSETRAVEAMEDAEEVILTVDDYAALGAPPSEARDTPDVVVVVRGVRADVDPAKIVDAEGHLLWAPGPPGEVRELERSDHTPVSLFELPGRTWVIASNRARERARSVFAHPVGRPALEFGPQASAGKPPALVLMRTIGLALVARIPALTEHGAFATVGRKLDTVTLELPQGSPPGGPEGAGAATGDAGAGRDVRATLDYADEDAAAFAEMTIRQVIGAIGRQKPSDLGWLSAAAVERPGKRVVIDVPLPDAFVGALLRARSTILAPPSPP